MRLVTFGIALGWTQLTGDSTNPQQFLVDGAVAGGWMFVGLVAFGGLVVPFAEELLFRGVVYSALRRYGAVSPRWAARHCSASPTACPWCW